MRMLHRTRAVTAVLALVMAACTEALDRGEFLDIQVLYNEPITSAVTEVRASLWDVALGGLGPAPPLSWTATREMGDEMAALHPLTPAGTQQLDIECLAINALGRTIGRGVTRAVDVVADGPTPVTCRMLPTAAPGRPDGIEVGLPGEHVLDALAVYPEPVDCAAGFQLRYELRVSDAHGNPFDLYATGRAASVLLPDGSTPQLRGHVLKVVGLRAAPEGSLHLLGVGQPWGVARDVPVNLWVIDPDSRTGLAIRSTTRCATEEGTQDVEVRPVDFFFADGEGLTFEVTRDGKGDLTWACDTDLDGRPDRSETAAQAVLLAAQVTGDATFDLLLAGDGPTAIIWEPVDCRP